MRRPPPFSSSATEILSGRTKDKNIGFIADTLTDIGIDLEEVRIVSDKEEAIVEAIRALSGRYDFVFTSGGIGPNARRHHRRFGSEGLQPADRRRPARRRPPDAVLEGAGIVPNESRLRMARIPEGAKLITNSVSAAPGFVVKNVFVMAGGYPPSCRR